MSRQGKKPRRQKSSNPPVSRVTPSTFSIQPDPRYLHNQEIAGRPVSRVHVRQVNPPRRP